MERTPNKSRHRKLTLEKKILPLLLPGFELATFPSRVWRSTNKLSRLQNKYSAYGTLLDHFKCSKVNNYSCLKLSLLRKAINVQKATTKNTENPDLKLIPHIRHSKKIYLPTGCVGASMCARRTFTASKGSLGAESKNEKRINPNSILFRTSTTARQFTRVWVCAFMSMHKLLT